MGGETQPPAVTPPAAGGAAKAAPVKTEEVVVAKGRTVFHDGRHRGPGSKISVPVEEASHLRAAGFLFVAEDEAPEETGVSVNGETKSVVRPK